MSKQTSVMQDVSIVLSFFGVPSALIMILIGAGWEDKLLYPGITGIGLWIIGLILWRYNKYGWIMSVLGISILLYLYFFVPILPD